MVVAMGLSAVVSHALARSTIPMVLPAIESELSLTEPESGFLGSSNFFAYLIGVVIATAGAGRLAPKHLLLAGLTAASLGFSVLSQAGTFEVLIVGQILGGLGSAGIWMSAPVLATSVVGANRRGMVMGFLSSMMGVGIVATSQGTRLARHLMGNDQVWRPTWIGAAIFGLLLVLIVALFIRVPTIERGEGRISVGTLRLVPLWGSVSIAYWLFGIVVSSFTLFFGLLLKRQEFSPSHISNVFSLFGLAAALSAAGFGWVSDRVGRRPVLVGSMSGMAIACVLALIGSEPFSSIAATIFGSLSFTFPVLIAAYLRDYTADHQFASALGSLTVLYSTALILGPSLAGAVADSSLGLRSVFVILGGISIAGSLVATTVDKGPDS